MDMVFAYRSGRCLTVNQRQITYTYDQLKRLPQKFYADTSAVNYTYDNDSRPGVTYTFDNDGNTQTMVNSSGTTTYNWDYENRMTSVVLPGGGGTVSFKYDPFGRRIYKSSSAGTSVFAYDGDNLVEETNATGAVVARYSQGLNIDEPLAILRSGTTSYYQADGLGSLTSLSNTAGTLANTYTYDSFGNLTASTGSITNSFRYTGREFDTETSLYYYRARYYDPATARLSSEDLDWGNRNYSLYFYVLNNPLNFKDPSGLSPCECKGTTGGGIKTAVKCCQDTAPVSSDTGAPPYDPCFNYMWVNANLMYRHGGDGTWGKIVRGCLKCAYQYGAESNAAHVFCYGEGYRRQPLWMQAIEPIDRFGFGRAVAGAAGSIAGQIGSHIWNRGAKPFTCMNVK